MLIINDIKIQVIPLILGEYDLSRNKDRDFYIFSDVKVKQYDAFYLAQEDYSEYLLDQDKINYQSFEQGNLDTFLIYKSKNDSDNILTVENIKQMQKIEEKLRNQRQKEWEQMCLIKDGENFCNYYYSFPQLIADQQTIDQQKIDTFLEKLQNDDEFYQFVQLYYLGEDYERGSQKIKLARSLYPFGYPFKGFNSLDTDTVNEMENQFLKWSKDFHEFIDDGQNTDSMQVWYYNDLGKDDFEEDQVKKDLLFALFSLIFVLAYISFHFKSIFLGICGTIIMLVSFPLAFFVYKLVYQIDYFVPLHFSSIFLIIGIGTDDIYVFHDNWKQARYHTQWFKQDIYKMMSYTYRKSAFPMLITNITAITSFLASAIEPIVPLKTFGIFSATAIIFNYILALTLFPCVLIWYELMRQKIHQKKHEKENLNISKWSKSDSLSYFTYYHQNQQKNKDIDDFDEKVVNSVSQSMNNYNNFVITNDQREINLQNSQNKVYNSSKNKQNYEKNINQVTRSTDQNLNNSSTHSEVKVLPKNVYQNNGNNDYNYKNQLRNSAADIQSVVIKTSGQENNKNNFLYQQEQEKQKQKWLQKLQQLQQQQQQQNKQQNHINVNKSIDKQQNQTDKNILQMLKNKQQASVISGNKYKMPIEPRKYSSVIGRGPQSVQILPRKRASTLNQVNNSKNIEKYQQGKERLHNKIQFKKFYRQQLFFLRYWTKWTYKLRWVIMVIFAGFMAINIYGTQELESAQQTYLDVQEESFYYKAYESIKNDFLEIKEDSVQVYLVWGIKGVDRDDVGLFETEYKGKIIWDENFDLSSQENQENIINVCEHLRKDEEGFFLQNAENSLSCFMENFQEYVENQKNEEFPVKQANFNSYFGEFLDSTSGIQFKNEKLVGFIDGKLKYATVKLTGHYFKQTISHEFEILYEEFHEIVDEYNQEFLNENTKIQFQTSESWLYIATQEKLIHGAILEIIISLVLAYVIVTLLTKNYLMTFYAIVCIVGIILGVLMVIWAKGWQFGIYEAMNSILIIGLAVDYTIHLVYSYKESLRKRRYERTQDMVKVMGISVFSGALTTLGAGLFLLGGKLRYFQVMGTFVSATIGFSLVWSMVFLVGLCHIIGVQRNQGHIPKLCRRFKKVMKKSDGKKGKQQQLKNKQDVEKQYAQQVQKQEQKQNKEKQEEI